MYSWKFVTIVLVLLAVFVIGSSIMVYFESRDNASGGLITFGEVVSPFKFIDHNEEVVSETFVDGSVAVISFHCSYCKDDGTVVSHLLNIANEYKMNQNVKLLSHFISGINYDIPSLRMNYENYYSAFSNWKFVTGQIDSLYYKAHRSYMLSVHTSDHNHMVDFNLVSLLNKNRTVAGIYNLSHANGLMNLERDINILLKEN